MSIPACQFINSEIISVLYDFQFSPNTSIAKDLWCSFPFPEPKSHSSKQHTLRETEVQYQKETRSNPFFKKEKKKKPQKVGENFLSFFFFKMYDWWILTFERNCCILHLHTWPFWGFASQGRKEIYFMRYHSELEKERINSTTLVIWRCNYWPSQYKNVHKFKHTYLIFINYSQINALKVVVRKPTGFHQGKNDVCIY